MLAEQTARMKIICECSIELRGKESESSFLATLNPESPFIVTCRPAHALILRSRCINSFDSITLIKGTICRPQVLLTVIESISIFMVYPSFYVLSYFSMHKNV